MNCKQGDAAVITRSTPLENSEGLIVKVLEFRGHYSADTLPPWLVGRPRWLVRAQRECVCFSGRVAREFTCPDAYLRPIRDPGEDATDETLVPGYVKHKEHA